MLERIAVCAPPNALEEDVDRLVARASQVTARLAPGVEVERRRPVPPGLVVTAPIVLVNDRPAGHRADAAPPDWVIEASLVHALEPRHLLFLGVANSARSLLAERMARALAPPGVRISSAGSAPGSVHPETIEVLSEINLDASGLRSKAIDAVDVDTVQVVVTLCAEEVCPTILRPVPRLHWPIADPAAAGEGTDEHLGAFRTTRDLIRERLYVLFHG